VFSQIVDYLPWYEFQKCVSRYRGDAHHRGFSRRDQFLAMAFAQLTYRESLRDVEACLGAVGGKLYHMGFRGRVARSTLADANESHDWRIFADFAQHPIGVARPLYAGDALGVDLDASLYALDSTTIGLCLALFPWARFRKEKGAVKMHTLLDLHGNIPAFIHISDGKRHDVHALDRIPIEPGAYYAMDRGYLDFERLYRFTLGSAFFVTRTKKNVLLQRRYSHPVDKSTGVSSDQTVILTSFESASVYPDPLRTRSGSPHQSLLRHQRECRQDSNLDRRLGLRPRRHRAKATYSGGQPLPNPTDLERHPVRENPHFTGTSEPQLPIRVRRIFQPTDSVQLIAGHQ
jgi:hypothetical protein